MAGCLYAYMMISGRHPVSYENLNRLKFLALLRCEGGGSEA